MLIGGYGLYSPDCRSTGTGTFAHNMQTVAAAVSKWWPESSSFNDITCNTCSFIQYSRHSKVELRLLFGDSIHVGAHVDQRCSTVALRVRCTTVPVCLQKCGCYMYRNPTLGWFRSCAHVHVMHHQMPKNSETRARHHRLCSRCTLTQRSQSLT